MTDPYADLDRAALVARLHALEQRQLAFEEDSVRFRTLFECSPVSLWEEDLSEVRIALKELQARYGDGLREHLATHPATVADLAGRVRVLAVNQATLQQFGAGSLETFRPELPRLFTQGSLAVFREEVLALLDGATQFCSEAPHLTMEGEERQALIQVDLAPGHEGVWSRVFVSMVDITARKREETARIAVLEGQRLTLVREVHHRIKNHLQGVTGLLREQAREHPEVAGMLDKAICRIGAIADVYGLHSSRVDGRVRFCDIVRMAVEGAPAPVPVSCRLPEDAPVCVENDEAVPLALVVNELLANACKHLAPSDPKRPLRVSLECGEAGALLTLRGGPARLPDGFDFETGVRTGTGLGLVRALLPRQGVSLRYRQEGDEVVTMLKLKPPVIAV